MDQNSHHSRRHSIQRHLVIGTVTVAVLFGGVGGWAATTEISGAVITAGRVVVASNVKKIQHPTGGIVSEILVSDGEGVEQGQPLMRLDPTQTRANLAILMNTLEEMQARRARLEAERDDKSAITFPPGLPDEIVAGETRLFESRGVGRSGQKSQLNERIIQLQEEAKGLDAQMTAKSREVALVDTELKGIRDLYAKRVVPLNRLTELERAAAQLQGEHGQIQSAAAQVRGRMAEVELQILQIDQDLRAEVSAELSDLRARISETLERKLTAEDQLERVVIRAPLKGTVHELSVHTIGAVIQSGETLMHIVPDEAQLTVEARVPPRDIDRVVVGQEVLLRFSAFDQRETPEILGTVSRIAAAISVDADSNTAFYTIRIAIDESQKKRLGDARLIPGMPVETFVRTGERTVASYLLKPLSDQITRAFREE